MGQNLVFNPSFEDTLACPWGQDELDKAIGWSSYSISPDYMNSCSSHWISGVPDNWGGYQFPNTGNGYVGFSAFTTNYTNINTREFLGSQLTSTLTVGTRYFVNLKVSTGFLPAMNANCAVNNLGATFSTISYSASNPMPLNNSPQTYSTTIVSDTTNWTTISGSFIADSAYNFIVIGNFFSDNFIDTLILDSDSLCRGAYYFVDDISVSSDSLDYWTGINNVLTSKDVVSAYPNPFSDRIVLQNTGGNENYELMNTLGQIIYSGKNIQNADLNLLHKGIYLLKILTEDSHQTIKLLKQ